MFYFLLLMAPLGMQENKSCLTKIINMFNIKPQNSEPYTTKNYVIHMCINTLILLNTRSRR
jgi:hypothetical protein